jgi:hypothetical protein
MEDREREVMNYEWLMGLGLGVWMDSGVFIGLGHVGKGRYASETSKQRR